MAPPFGKWNPQTEDSNDKELMTVGFAKSNQMTSRPVSTSGFGRQARVTSSKALVGAKDGADDVAPATPSLVKSAKASSPGGRWQKKGDFVEQFPLLMAVPRLSVSSCKQSCCEQPCCR
jgi:hypothetical protein